MYANGRGVPQDYAAAATWYRKAADQGQIAAQGNLGLLYFNGQGVPQDYAEALKWFRKAADQKVDFAASRVENVPADAPSRGVSSAQYRLGVMYADGRGVPQDYAAAATWYRKAADQGDPAALVTLGLMHAEGQGVPQDYVQALKWVNLAATRASDSELRAAAVKIRDLLAAKMTPKQIAEAQKLAREWKPTPYDYPHPKDAGKKPG